MGDHQIHTEGCVIKELNEEKVKRILEINSLTFAGEKEIVRAVKFEIIRSKETKG